MASGEYRHYVPAISLSIEKNTRTVPQNNKYHVIYKGQIMGSYRSRKQAEQQFYQLLASSGYKPDINEDTGFDSLKESVDNFFQSKSLFWTEGPLKGKKGRFTRR